MSIDAIRELWRERQDHHKEEKALTLRIRARLRRLCDGDKTEAEKLYKSMMKDGDHPLSDYALALNERFLECRERLASYRKDIEKQLNGLAKELAVAPFVEDVKGFSYLSLAAIVGECGDLNNYATKERLWKRMGLAVIDGRRQRRVAGAEALKHGYAAHRRSIMWNIGACILKAQSSGKSSEIHPRVGHYRVIYDQRRAYEEAKNEAGDYAGQAKETLKEKSYGKQTAAYKAYSIGMLPPGHLHARSQRVMEKQFLEDLWKAWRRANSNVENSTTLPAAA